MSDLKHVQIVTEIARVCHEANAAYTRAIGGMAQAWHEASRETRESAQAGVIEVLKNPGVTPQMMHAAWMGRKLKDGWTHGDVKDEAAKTHPCLVDWPFLPQHEKVKDELFIAIVRALYPQ